MEAHAVARTSARSTPAWRSTARCSGSSRSSPISCSSSARCRAPGSSTRPARGGVRRQGRRGDDHAAAHHRTDQPHRRARRGAAHRLHRVFRRGWRRRWCRRSSIRIRPGVSCTRRGAAAHTSAGRRHSARLRTPHRADRAGAANAVVAIARAWHVRRVVAAGIATAGWDWRGATSQTGAACTEERTYVSFADRVVKAVSNVTVGR